MSVSLLHDHRSFISSPDEIIAEAQQGRMFILADDEDRENEGDLVIPAQFATPEAINFMARFGRGLICLAMERKRAEHLNIPLIAQQNTNHNQAAFTVSIEAREGVTTGVSAADRAHTIQTAISPSTGPQDIATPGHVFPLLARDGGVLVRAGHTESAVDVARLAGLIPAGVICEILNEDGSMARMPDLISFARTHKLKVGTVADLIAYRRRTETLVERRLSRSFTSMHGGTFDLYVYVNKLSGAEHVALVKGKTGGSDPLLVRMHALNVLEDVLGDRSAGHGGELQSAMRMISEAGRGVIVLLREAQNTALSERLSSEIPLPHETYKQDFLRDYGVGAQILLDLGVRDMVLLSNSQRTIVGLDGYGLRVTEQRAIK
jgi:3,4-dihydroxy 2-butanone 4-phosphate synthase/GTP cyclohydrolase II